MIGEKGTLKWDGLERLEAQVVKSTGGFHSKFRTVALPPWTSSEKIGGHKGLMREFVQCIQKGTVPETTCTDNVKSLAMVFGAIESAASGKRVRIRW